MDLTPLTSAIESLRAIGHQLIARLTGHGAAPPAKLQAAREHRVARALNWLAALGSIFAGERTYHRPARFVPPDDLAPFFAPVSPSAPKAARVRPVATDAARAKSREAGRLAYIRRVFATVPTGTLATRLARRLGLTPNDDAWPHALVAIAEPPAIWAARAHPAAASVHPVRQVNAILRAVRVYEKTVALVLAEIAPHPGNKHRDATAGRGQCFAFPNFQRIVPLGTMAR